NRSYDANGDLQGDAAPEIIKFVSADDSPSGSYMLLVGYEVSGTVGIIELDGNFITSTSEYLKNEVGFKVYPNPATRGNLNFDVEISGQVVNEVGQKVMDIEESESINIDALSPGMYFIQSTDLGTQRFLKM